jgi:hypothetical protein
VTNDNGGQATESTGLTAFGTTGFTIGADADYNTSAATYVSWTFREQPKFFDVLTYTGTGTAHAINHNLGSVPGFIIVKSTSVAGSWYCYHRGTNGGVNPQNYGMNLGATAAQLAYINFWNNTAPTATQFTVGDAGGETNETGVSYVAYLFAHDAGGFGLEGTDNVISCGSYTGNGSTTGPIITLGYEPQWSLYKRTDVADDWILTDNMRGFAVVGATKYQNPNTSSSESSYPLVSPLATGFQPRTTDSTTNASGGTYIYIAIRRGPMKVPTLGTSVYSPNVVNAPLATKTTVGFPIDLQIFNYLPGDGGNSPVLTRLAGVSTNSTSSGSLLKTSSTAAESSAAGFCLGWDNTGFQMPSGYTNSNVVFYNFGRAPGFFDVVCYTGTGVAGLTVAHNLTVVPDLMIVKGRSIAEEWNVYFGNNTNYLKLNRTDVPQTSTTRWNDTSPTSSVFSLGTSNWVNGSGSTYVAYLFATLAGVSKVFSYTGNGSSQTINCGFTGGSRFVMIKRTDAAGDWYVWDSARGIVAGNDPHLSLNTTAAEVTTDDSVDTDNTGFIVNQVAATNVNVSSATYIGLAIA